MAKVAFSKENKSKNPLDFPKLKLENGERARIVLLEDPEVEFVHRLVAPRVENGKVVMETATRRDKSTYETYTLDFIGSPLCLGDQGILESKGSDPKNCPVCALAAEGDMAEAPDKRYAMHVVRYQTEPGGFNVAEPLSAQTLVWAISQSRFNQLVDFQEEWGSLKKHDLLLGPCTGKQYQKYDINVSATAAWLQDETTQKYVAATFKNNQAADITVFIGSKKERRWLDEDIEKVRSAWALVFAAEGKQSPVTEFDSVGASASLDAGLDSLLDEAGSATAAAAPAASAMDIDDLLGGDTTSEAPAASSAALDVDDLLGDVAAAPEAEKPKETVAAATTPSGAVDVDDLLAGL